MNTHINKLNIAVIGSGISGLGAAWLLSKQHNVTVYEADSHFGGHANTVDAHTPNGDIPVDTGFIVCNDRNYPNFLSLMDHIGITPFPTEMSFGVSMDNKSFEYAGSENLKSMFAQPSNILRPRFWKMVRSILRFYKKTADFNLEDAKNITLQDYLNKENYDEAFLRDHILPMAAAIWSTPSQKVGEFPLSSFLNFCRNHGLLQLKDRPQWFTIPGGSRNYVQALMRKTDAAFINNAPITAIKRMGDHVMVTINGEETKKYDRILIATHADTALKMIKDADPLEKEILGGFKYSKNLAILHSDTDLMPKRKGAWASWNYLHNDSTDNLSVSYWMNKLQPLGTEAPMIVTLNPDQEPKEELVHYSKEYMHPIFDMDTFEAQKRSMEIMGHRNIWYAGAHFGYGFHEDGLQSGLFAAENMVDVYRPWDIEDMNGRIIALQEGNVPASYKPVKKQVA